MSNTGIAAFKCDSIGTYPYVLSGKNFGDDLSCVFFFFNKLWTHATYAPLHPLMSRGPLWNINFPIYAFMYFMYIYTYT